MWEVVLEAFLKSGQGEKEAIRNARMARILREDEFDTDTKEITLWTPEGKAETFDASSTKEKVLIHEPNLWRTP
jgi:DNA polymerase-1